jgi:hypothetical protein
MEYLLYLMLIVAVIYLVSDSKSSNKEDCQPPKSQPTITTGMSYDEFTLMALNKLDEEEKRTSKEMPNPHQD